MRESRIFTQTEKVQKLLKKMQLLKSQMTSFISVCMDFFLSNLKLWQKYAVKYMYIF